MVRFGVIGAGRIGRMHARNLTFRIPDAEVLAVSDIYVDGARNCAQECRIPKAVQDHREIMEDPDIDAIFVCSSTETHSQMIIEGAEAGKHIFCEKPIDADIARIDAALDAVEKAGVKLQIGFNRRFDPDFKHARDSVAAGRLGTPHVIKITSRDPEPPPIDYVKASGGLFFDMMIHDFDMCRYLMGEEVVEIYAAGTSLVDPKIGEVGDIDTAVVTLTYDSGAYCIIDNSRKAVYGYDQRIEVFGTEGCVVVGNPAPYAATFFKRGKVEYDPLHYFFLDRYKDAYLLETLEFIKCIKDDRVPAPTGIDGKIPVLMAMAAAESLKERRPVPLTVE
ncbi:inositol 2-dehydrogenase [candidate division KSB3 bacterium]|uniref:Inositol 2-dehydrogenase n=1 Tax=candidate division KSB3 bacterium TaxID=2044937 RepID=A0A2G6E2N7_9BACT|nr:MAG: inositol 2-dehydrogenase [candidate division KSB3 bacterium]PIE28741.1 MAG: inositol 2-dehydrogenase [candidate division KSB3 bacterium]